ncbi:MAG: hypothetical protein HRU41_33110 [Saprospiraceae bacterium]|nr:hypothetical protein [Saprospiraceae bacterium]
MKSLDKYKLVQNLQMLKRDELGLFYKWLISPWCNSNSRIVELFKVLKPYYPSFASKRLTKQFLFAKLYPDTDYNDRWLRNLMAELNQSLLRFYTHQALSENSTTGKKLLIESLLARDNPQSAIRLASDLLTNINQGEVLSSQDYHDSFFLNNQLYYQPNTPFRQQKGTQLLHNASEALDYYYLLNKLRLISELTGRSARLNVHGSQSLDLSLLHELHSRRQEPAIDLYLRRLADQDKISRPFVEGLMDFYMANYSNMSKKDKQLLLWYLINDCTQVYKQGVSEILAAIFELYKFGIKNELLLAQGRLTESTYLNIVGVGNALKDFSYVQEFVFRYTQHLPSEVREDATTWSKAHCYYHQGFFDDAIAALIQYDFKNKLFTHRARIIEVQAYFEIFLQNHSYYLLFSSNLSALEAKMRNEKRLSQENSSAIVRMIQYVKKLGKWVSDPNATPEGLAKIEANLSEEYNIQGMIWLEEKINLLKKGLHKKAAQG